MNNVTLVFERATISELKRAIEPLANYICATDQPQTALKSALALLFREVEATNRVARRQVRTCRQN